MKFLTRTIVEHRFLHEWVFVGLLSAASLAIFYDLNFWIVYAWYGWLFFTDAVINHGGIFHDK